MPSNVRKDLLPYLPVTVESLVYRRKRLIFKTWRPRYATLRSNVILIHRLATKGAPSDGKIEVAFPLAGAKMEVRERLVQNDNSGVAIIHVPVKFKSATGKTLYLAFPVAAFQAWETHLLPALHLSETKLEDFEIIEQIGTGSYARVMRVRHSDTGEELALKIMPKGNPHKNTGDTQQKFNGVKAAQIKFLVHAMTRARV